MMRRETLARPTWLILWACLAWGSRGEARPEPAAPKYIGGQLCSNCHTEPGANPADFNRLTEFKTWRMQDKHSLAFVTLTSPRARRMGEVLKADVTKPESGCFGCHALDGVAGRLPKTLNILQDGVTCEACHGASESWLGPHICGDFRDKAPAEKTKLGMTDIRDPAVQNRVCISCHVGKPGEGKFLTHAMLAAGHPALPAFTAAAAVEAMPRHWEYTRDVPWLKKDGNPARKNYNWDDREFQQTRTLLVGIAVTLQGFSQGVEARATAVPEFSRRLWPELRGEPWEGRGTVQNHWSQLMLSHIDCKSCHHMSLTAVGLRAAPASVQPDWSRVLLPLLDVPVDGLPAALTDLDAAVRTPPGGTPAGVAKPARAATRWAEDLVTRTRSRPLDRAAVRRLLETALALGSERPRDFDSARQIVAAITVMGRELHPGRWRDPVDLEKSLNLLRASNAAEREGLLWEVVEKVGEKGVEGLRKASASGPGGNLVGKALLSDPFSRRLAESNERAARAAAETRARYRPADFQRAVRELRDGLPAEK